MEQRLVTAARNAVADPSPLPLYRRLAEALSAQLTQAAPPVLPPARRLAARVGLNRATVTAAYRELARQGLTELRPGRPRGQDRGALPEPETGGPEVEPPPGAHDLARYAPNRELLPGGAVFRWLGFGEGEGEGVAQYGTVWGHPPLRKWVASRLAGLGIPVETDGLLLTSGVQHALDLVFRALAQAGDGILVEDPAYPGLPPLLATHRVRPLSVPIHPDGLHPEDVFRAVRRRSPRMAIITPTLHNPSGVVLGADERREIVGCLQGAGVLVVEEYFDPALVAEGPVPPPMAALSQGVIVVGSFSKALFPGLRVGWVAGPPAVVRRLAAVKRATDLSGSPFLEAAAWSLCNRGVLEDQLGRLRREALRRRQVVFEALDRTMQPGFRWSRPRGGFSLLVFLPAGTSSRAVANRAARAGSWVLPGPLMSVSGRDDVLRVAYAAHGGATLRQGMHHVISALEGVAHEVPLV